MGKTMIRLFLAVAIIIFGVVKFCSSAEENPYTGETQYVGLSAEEEIFDQNYECFGVYHGEELIGVFGLWFMTRHYAGRSCEPDHVYVKPEYQNKGIGREIFNFIFEYAEKKGCETAELNSYVHNFKSHKFYMNHGFVIKGYHFLKKL